MKYHYISTVKNGEREDKIMNNVIISIYLFEV